MWTAEVDDSRDWSVQNKIHAPKLIYTLVWPISLITHHNQRSANSQLSFLDIELVIKTKKCPR